MHDVLPLPPVPVQIRRLPNGVECVALPMPHAATTTICADVRVGARYESARDAGLSHFLEHMVFQGCDGHPTADAVNEVAECMGTALDAYTSRDSTHFEHQVSPERACDAVSLLANVLCRPHFHDIEAERSIILEEALDEVDERGRLIDAESLSRQSLWPDSPLGQSVVGSPKNLERFGEADLRRHHERHYGGENLIVAAAGPHGAEEMLDWLGASFGQLRPGERLVPDPPAPTPERLSLVYVDDPRSQVDCRLVYRTAGALAPGGPAVTLARMALDDGLAGRMHRRLGSELGLAYDLWATWERYPDVGAFELGAQVSPNKVPVFFAEARALLWGLATDPPRGAELERLRFRARFHLRSTLDRAEGRMLLLATHRLYPVEPESPAERLARYDAVTSDEIAAAFEALLAQPSVGVCVGKLTRTVLPKVKDLVKDPGRPKPSRPSAPHA